MIDFRYYNGNLKEDDREYLTDLKKDILKAIANKKTGGSGGGSVAGAFVGACALVASFSLGPVDLMRSAYNQVIGDTPVIKSRLVDYCREGIKIKQPYLCEGQIELSLESELELNPNANVEDIKSKICDDYIEQYLASELNVNLNENGKINPLEASISDLWDASEDYAHADKNIKMWPELDYLWQRFVWPSL